MAKCWYCEKDFHPLASPPFKVILRTVVRVFCNDVCASDSKTPLWGSDYYEGKYPGVKKAEKLMEGEK